MLPNSTKRLILLCFLSLGVYTSFSQVKNDFDVRYEADIRGELTFIGNNIVNRKNDAYSYTYWSWSCWCYQTVNVPATTPNDPYDLTGSASDYNDNLDMAYIDIDGDASTFSSSSSTLDIPDESCSKIRYAGLYWSAVYVNPDRSTIDDVKFQVPGGSYQDITADEILFDGDGDTDFGYYSPYACYKDVTSIVSALPNPDGEYFMANVRASSGNSISGGVSGGWTMVVVYENPNLPGSKFITTFDGYAGIKSGETTDIPISGFTTLPAPFNVNANIAVAALEGDNRIGGDGLAINATGSFTPLSSTVNPVNNFFNSNLSIDPNAFTARNPNSINTLGWDVDQFPIVNNFNSVIPNDATSAILRASSTQDKYDIFFAAFDVEIIAPNIVLKKRVEDIGGNDITGQGVNLGQTLDYVLSFQNIGNDDATNYTIRDVLPINVSPPNGTDFIPADMTLPAGVTYTYDQVTGTVVFTIPDNLVNEGDPKYSIRMRVKVAENCFDFIDACSDLIQNLAYSTYQGVENSALVTDDPSVSDFDACGFIIPGATNFLLDDLSDCNFERTVELCGANVLLDAGDNFDDYVWKRDDNGNGIFDASDTTIDDGDPDNDPSTLQVHAIGTYIVDKIVADPCKGFKEIIHVVPYGSGTIPNPIIEYFNAVNSDADLSNDLPGEIVQCSIDNAFLPKLFLCGTNDIRNIQVNILDAQSIVWEKLDESSCASVGDDCANKNLTCTWNQVGTGNNYALDSAGKYRLFVNYQNGCSSKFYFNVFQNTLNIEYNKHDILCTTPGNITITNLGNGYGYQLVDSDTNAVLIPFSANNGPSFDFAPGQNGGYRVEVTQLDASGIPIVGACLFSTPSIGILERNVTYDVSATNATCSNLGSINIQVNNADPNYEYEIRLDDGSNGGQGTLLDNETSQPDNNFTFDNLNPGDYFAIAKTDDGCIHVESVTILDEDDLDLTVNVTQPILCGNGIIEMQASGGQPAYSYAIWNYVDEGGTTVISYPTPQDIPPSEFQTNTDFNITAPGDYTFIVVDDNNCYHESNTVTITEPTVEYTTSFTDESCFGQADGSISANVTNSHGYTISFLLTYPDSSTVPNTSGSFTNLPQGDYTLDIVQRNGTISCEIEETFTIGGPTEGISGDLVIVNDYTCLQNGSIQVQNVTGGTPPYEYSIDGVNFANGAGADTFPGLTNGTYTITIRDANLCTFTTPSVTLDPLNEPSDLTFASTAPNCPAQTSDVTVTVVDGNTPFVFDIIAPSPLAASSISGNTADFNALAPGTYTFRVTDDKGCIYTEDFTISPVTQIAVTSQLDNNISCFGIDDGAATFNVSNFNTSYDYAITGPTVLSGSAETANALPLTGLAPGTYAITVTDTDTNCIATADVTIASPPANLVISNLAVTDLICSTSGTVPGSVTITATDGWGGGYEYELEDPLGVTVGPQGSNSFTGLTDTSGNYTVTVRDAGGCEATQTFNLNPTVSPALDISANNLCYDSSAGLTLTANVTSGGEAPFEYRLNGGPYQTSPVFTGLAPGSHTIEVIDNKNCTGTASINVFPTLTASANLIKDLDCTATPDAEISINISGGNPTFNYEVFRDGSSVQPSTAVPSIPFSYFTNTEGTYEFVITDSENCTITTNLIVVSPNNPPTVIEVVTEPLCNTSADGIAELQISGGTPPYQIVFDGSAPSTQTTYPALVAGTYNYTVTDAKGCVLTDDVTLTPPTPLLPGTVDVVIDYRCDNASATLQAINYSGGTAPYTFSIDGVNFQGSDTFNTGITAGTYTITIRDDNGCTALTPPITIDPLDSPTDLSFAPTAPVCPAVTADVTVTVTDGTSPFTYEIIAPAVSVTNNGNNNVFVGLAPGTYTFQVTDDKGCVLQEDYTVTDIPRVDVISQLTNNVSCLNALDGAFTFTVSDFVATYSYTIENSTLAVVQSANNIALTTPIAAGPFGADTYTVTITDDTTGCSDTTTIMIDNPTAVLDFTFTNTDVTCIDDSTITVSAFDGWGSYEYQLENTVGPVIVYPYQSSNSFINVPPGTYNIYVRDAGGCIVDKPITVDPAQNPSIAFGASDLCFDGTDQASLVVDITGGVAPYSYAINGGGLTVAVGDPFTISNLIPGTYTIQVTDAYGCVSNVISQTIEPQLTATATLTQDLLCTANAIIDIAISGGYTPYANYEVSFNGGAYAGTTAIVGNSFTYSTAAVAGTYRFRITDAQNCSVETNEITITPTEAPQANHVVTDVACFGGADGSVFIDIDPNFGTAPYTISFDGSGFTSTTTYSGLAAGTYTYIVRDSRGCEFTDDAVVNEPLQILSNINARDVTCSNVPGGGNILGGVDVTITQGGFANFTYTLYDSANNIVVLGSGDPNPVTSASPSHSFNGVDFGDYYVRIIDANGCESDLGSVRVRSNPYLSLTANIPPPDCPTGGTAVITATGGSGDYTFDIYDIGTPPNSEIVIDPSTEEATFNGLNPGQTYIIRAVDNVNHCTSYQEVIIPPLSTITAVIDNTTNITCASANDGIMTFTVDNYDPGVTDIDYEILNALTNTPVVGPGTYTGTLGSVAGGPQSLTITQIPPGDYVLFVDEATLPSCSATATFRITEPTPVALQLIGQTTANCSNHAEVTVRASGGTGPYNYAYVIDGAPAPGAFPESTTFTLDPTVSLVWDIYAQDANGCISPLLDVTITQDPSPEITAAINDQCTADEGNFSVDITLDVDGVAPYTLRIDGAAPQAATGLSNAGDTMTISNLSSGAHTFEILDVNGCGETESLTIYPPLVLLATISAHDNCNPTNSGEVTIIANGGSGNYTYSQITPAGPTEPTGVFAGLTHSIAYTFEVEDTTTNCTTTVGITLPAPELPTFTLEPTHVSCFGGNDGTITVNLDPGNIDTPYLFSHDGGITTQLSNVFNGLSQDTYNITVISDKGCEDTKPIDVNEPTQLDIDASASAFSCNDASSTITVTINDATPGNPSGTGPYVYSFDGGTNFQTGNTYPVPFGPPNVITVVVRDANNCTDTEVVAVPTMQEVTAVVNKISAPIDCVNGQEIIEIVASNGSGTYTYTQLPSGNIVPDPANIILTQPGTYVYEVLDTITHCSVTVEHIIAPYDLIDVTAAIVTDATCSDSTDGVIEVTVTGYTNTFDYVVLDNTGTPVGGTANSDNATSDPYVFNVPTSLPAGTYSVQITQTAFPECVAESNKVTIDAPEPLVLQLIDNVNANCNMANAVVTVQATGGTAPYTYGASVSGAGVPATFPFDNTIELDPTISLNWDIYVRDVNGCIITVPLAVTIDTDTTPDITLAIDDECADEGSFAITVSLDAINMGVAPYTMSINSGAFQSIASFPYSYTGLNAGAYTIEIRDANGCGETENSTIEPELSVSAVVFAQPTCATNDGVIEFTVAGGSGAYTADLLRSDLTPTGIAPTGNQFAGVAFGDYIVRITDNTLGTPNCIADAPISLEEPTPVTLLATDKTDVSCAGASDGSITVNLEPSSAGVNDNPPYTYEITNGTLTFAQSTGLFTGLAADTWDITVTSNRNCVATDQVIIDEPIAIAANITNVVPFACDINNAQQSATIEVTITPGTGTPDYFYSVNGAAFQPTGGTIFNHTVNTAGNYDIVIRDANGCVFALPTEFIAPLNTFTASVSQAVAITCAGPEEVLITVSDDGNPANTYTFELLPTGNPNGVQTGTPTNVTATYNLSAVGSYTFRVTDNATGCYVDTAPYTIAPFDLIDVTATAKVPVNCFGDGNGALEINISGYSGAFDYEVFTQAGVSLLTGSGNTNPFPISGLSGGNYYVRVTETDAASTLCSDDTNIVTIVSPDMPLTAMVTPLTDVTCTNDQGEILVDPSGGYAPYDITLTNTTTGQIYPADDVQSFIFTQLSAGNFTIEVIDNSGVAGCIYSDTEILVEPTQIVANATPLNTTLSCFGDTTGTVTAHVTSGGSGTYQYTLNYYDTSGTTIDFSTGSQSNDTFSGLGAGIYSITVSDGWNCDVETNQVTIVEPTLVMASLIRTDPLTCATGVAFELTATGGSGSYEYSVDNITFMPMTANPMGLPVSGTLGAGTYQYYVRDAINGCESVTSNAITEDPIEPLTLIVDQSAAFINCNGDNTAIIYAEADGGLGNYMYELYSNTVTPANRMRGPQSSGEFSGLTAGTYWVNVISEDCTAAPQEVIINEPVPLTYTENIVDASCFGEENGSITVTLAGGAGGYQYAISPNLNQFDTINTFDDLAPGNYTVIAQDQNGCFEQLEYTISEPAIINIAATSTPEICAGNEDGTISVSITGGTAPYRTAINSNTDADFVLDRIDFPNLAAGNYLIFVRDANDCETNITVAIDPGADLNATVEPIYECTGDTPNNYVNITLDDPSVLGDVLYALDSTDPSAMQLNPDFRDISPGSHYIAIAHANGCVQTADFEIQGYEPLTLILEQRNLNEITAIAEGGRLDYTFYFDGIDNGTDNTFYIKRTDTYQVRVVDENGCEAMANIFMEFIDIEIPNFFTPDGDTNNDFWKPANIEQFPEILIKIYDRYGRVVAEIPTNHRGWDGTYKGKELPMGDYWYVIKLNGEEDDREFVGHFTLYR